MTLTYTDDTGHEKSELCISELGPHTIAGMVRDAIEGNYTPMKDEHRLSSIKVVL